MITVKELIKKLQNEDQNAIMLIDSYEYDMEFLRLNKIEKGYFNLPKGSDINYVSCGGEIKSNKNGKLKYVKIGRIF